MFLQQYTKSNVINSGHVTQTKEQTRLKLQLLFTMVQSLK